MSGRLSDTDVRGIVRLLSTVCEVEGRVPQPTAHLKRRGAKKRNFRWDSSF